MKFEKLTLKNFKPYRDAKLSLYSEDRKTENMTLNVGRTGAGKTTISDAILWCLYGDLYLTHTDVEMKEWVNDLQKSIARERGDDEIQVQVSLSILVENGKKYRITRSNKFLLDQDKFKGEEFIVLEQGSSIDNPESFINENFVSMELMEYFVFDAEKVLERFNKDRAGTIKDNLNDLIGIEKFDEVKNLLNKIVGEDGFIQEKISNEKTKLADEDLKGKIDSLKETKKDIKDDLEKAKKEKQKLIDEQKAIFQGEPSKDVKKFDELKSKEEKLNEEMEECIKEYKETKLDDLQPEISDTLLKNLDYLFLEEVVENGLESCQTADKITNREYNRAKNKIQDAIKEDYSGLFFDKSDIKVLERNAEVNSEYLVEEEDLLEKLNKDEDYLNESKARTEFGDAEEDIKIVEEKFKKYVSKHNKIEKDLIKTRNEIDNLRETAEREEDRKKLREYEEYEDKIKEKKKEIKEYKEQIEVIKERISEKEEKNELNKKTEKKIKKLEKYEEKANELIELIKESKEQYTGDLLEEINEIASDFLRRVSKKNEIYHSIKVSAEYSFRVLNEQGNEVSNNQFNRGNRQIALMAFFISISSYLAEHQDRKIPYVIDDPLFRLDPGHDRRLLKELGKTREQVILHLIPEKEYREDMFEMFSVNTQNWIDIKSDRESKIEPMDPQTPIEYDIDKF